MSKSPEFSAAEFKEAKVDPISQFSTPITVCLDSVSLYSLPLYIHWALD
jgi:hypothetical protein